MCGLVAFEGKVQNLEDLKSSLEVLHHRGPDDTQHVLTKSNMLGFKRLAIMDLSRFGNQPFEHDGHHLVCNGEIYNFQALAQSFALTMSSNSDCEVILPIFLKRGLKELCLVLEGEFAFVIDNGEKLLAARDPLGIRPLFYGRQRSGGGIAFASEVKSLLVNCHDIRPFPPGHYFDGQEIKPFHSYRSVKKTIREEVFALQGIKKFLTEGVTKRLQSDAPLGFLLSGGLDSSLVCAIAQKYSAKPIRTFAIGMSHDAIDLKYAKIVADHIGSDHTEVLIDKEQVLAALPQVIYQLESFDITTIRASIGMYLLCQYIRSKTDIKVVLTGEVSDEIFGYKYTDFAPNAAAFQEESQKRVEELYMYDVLRADRCISACSLEARVPFSDRLFVEHVLSIAPELKLNKSGHGKYLLRKAFDDGELLPAQILWREKAAFSDAVGHSMVDYLKEAAQMIYSNEDLSLSRFNYKEKTPFTKESLWYRDIFESCYPKMSHLITDFWMPNKAWEGCQVDDPSARVLANYGNSGS